MAYDVKVEGTLQFSATPESTERTRYGLIPPGQEDEFAIPDRLMPLIQESLKSFDQLYHDLNRDHQHYGRLRRHDFGTYAVRSIITVPAGQKHTLRKQASVVNFISPSSERSDKVFGHSHTAYLNHDHQWQPSEQSVKPLEDRHIDELLFIHRAITHRQSIAKV